MWVPPPKGRHYPLPSHNGKDFLLLQAQLAKYSVLVHMIYTYIQQRILVTKSTHIKIPSQVSLIDCLVFKQQKTEWVWDVIYGWRHSYIYKNMLINVNFLKQKHYSLIRNTFQQKHQHHIESSQPISLANQLTGFYMIRAITERHFWTDATLKSK